jgi:nitroreductase
MSSITIDAASCNFCGWCARVCIGVLEQKEKKAVPTVAAPEDCYLCGHCVAVCPEDALAIAGAENLADFLRLRRSLRAYKKKAVPKEVVETLLAAARCAPTGANAQSLQYVIVQDRQTLDELTRLCIDTYREDLEAARDEAALASMDPAKAAALKTEATYAEAVVSAYDEEEEDPIFYRAPGLVVIHAPRELTVTPVEDSTLAAYAMMLMAETLGVGTCFIAMFYWKADRSKAIRKVLGISPEDGIYMAFTFGYPAVRFRRLVERKPPPVRWM